MRVVKGRRVRGHNVNILLIYENYKNKNIKLSYICHMTQIYHC